jgi:dihydroorotase-like cyclic amidohydrolase
MPDPFDLVIRGATLRGEAADIGVRNGRIARIGRDLTGRQEIPADGLLANGRARAASS